VEWLKVKAGGVAQGEGLEFKPQQCKKRENSLAFLTESLDNTRKLWCWEEPHTDLG
jgi:hypothetical protein